MNSFLQGIQTRLSSLLPKSEPKQPTIRSYGQSESGIALEEMQPAMEWLFLSLFNAEYQGQSHLFWLQPEENVGLKRQLQQLNQKEEPIFGYRCGDQTSSSPKGFYWRLMPEYPSLRIYQLEAQQED